MQLDFFRVAKFSGIGKQSHWKIFSSLKKITKKSYQKGILSLHSFPSPISHRSSRPLFCSAMSAIALPIPENTFKVHGLRQHMEVGPKSADTRVPDK